MIRYQLNCKDCSRTFSSWFASSKEYEKIKKLKLLNCNFCNSKKVEKSLMTPNIVNKKKEKEANDNKKKIEIKKKLIEYQKFIKNNFEFVGDNFTYEARSIHYNNNKKKKKKGIYGNATLDEVKELKDEGIETEMIPWVKENEN